MITQVTYARTFNLGNYESLRLEAVATVDDDAPQAAFEQARISVEAEYALMMQKVDASDRREAAYAPTASDKQRAFIGTLMERLGWSTEQIDDHALSQGIDMSGMTRTQASGFIDYLQSIARKEATEDGVLRWAQRVVTPAQPVATDPTLPF